MLYIAFHILQGTFLESICETSHSHDYLVMEDVRRAFLSCLFSPVPGACSLEGSDLTHLKLVSETETSAGLPSNSRQTILTYQSFIKEQKTTGIPWLLLILF